MNRETKRQKQRLLNVVRSLRESRQPEAFTMARFVHDTYSNSLRAQQGVKTFDCGTPACALGHYTARTDLQKRFSFRAAFGIADVFVINDNVTGLAIEHFYPSDVIKYFGITFTEYNELFAINGCGHAKTTTEAANYIEKFVARKFE